jgi:amidohydrolase
MDERQLEQWLAETRRDLHMHPELAWEEHRTTSRIMEILTGLGVEVRALDGTTGAVGVLRGGSAGPTLGLRADIDALPLQELNDVPYRSREDGKMHACGHDAHTAIMLGVARLLVESGAARGLRGNVKFLFQPAEERVNGAREMIAKGVLEDPHVDRVMAGHMVPDMAVGTVGVFRAQSHASADRFTLRIVGKGSHGGRPHEGVDPIVAGAHFVTAVQSVVGRNVNPTAPAVVTVGKFVAGTVGNVIPEAADLEGTIRALTPEVRGQLMGRLRELVAGMERSFLVRGHLAFHEGVPACFNDESVSLFLGEVAAELLGPDSVHHLAPSMGAEDFALFTEARPGAIVRLGCAPPDGVPSAPLHSPHFDIDEGVLMVGVRLFSEAARRYLA